MQSIKPNLNFFDLNFKIKVIAIISICLFTIYFATQLIYGERVANEGIGWDGWVYTSFARSHFNYLFQKTLNPYYFQKILPSIIIHELAKILHYKITTNPNTIIAFFVYNFCLLGMGVFLFYRVGRILSWSSTVITLGVIFLFCNFSILKMSVYYPVNIDVSAFFIGIITVYFYVRRSNWGLIVSLILGSFIIPSAVYVLAPLIIFPRQEQIKLYKFKSPNFLIPFLLTIPIIIWEMHCASKPELSLGRTPVTKSILPLSLMCVFFYCFYAFKSLVYPRIMFLEVKSQFNFLNTLIYCFIFIILKLFIYKFSNNEPPSLSISLYISWVSYMAMVNPLSFVVAHFMYFGPAVILMLLLWPAISNCAYELGIGAVFFVCLYILLAFDSESRQLINAWPMFVTLACCALNKSRISWSCTLAFTVLCLIFSRCWLQINVGVWDRNDFVFPAQMYFMNFGPWMITSVYVIFALLGIVTLITMHYMLKAEQIMQYNKK